MKDPTPLLAKVGHLGEIARLISVFFKSGRDSIGKSELEELVGRTSGAGHRYPTPGPSIQLAIALRLLRKTAQRPSALGRSEPVLLGRSDPCWERV
jgi:hypothetical protein